jgi:hypothetical protein
MPSHFDLDEKLRYFTEHKDEFDLLFVGSSATFRNYVPRVVDAELAAEGLEITSFNFGVVGFRSFETDFMVKWILAQHPARAALDGDRAADLRSALRVRVRSRPKRPSSPSTATRPRRPS